MMRSGEPNGATRTKAKRTRRKVMLAALAIALALAVMVAKFVDFSGGTRAQRAQLASDFALQAFAEALQNYQRVHGGFPTQEEGLKVLAQEGSARAFLAIPNDPWGHPYLYVSSKQNPQECRIGTGGVSSESGDDIWKQVVAR